MEQADLNFWTFLDKQIDRLPGWPRERTLVTLAIFGLDLILLSMAWNDTKLWDVEVFKVIIQAVTLTGILNMILAFHFAANKQDENRSVNTAKAFDAITATANASGNTTTADPTVIKEGDEITLEKK